MKLLIWTTVLVIPSIYQAYADTPCAGVASHSALHRKGILSKAELQIEAGNFVDQSIGEAAEKFEAAVKAKKYECEENNLNFVMQEGEPTEQESSAIKELPQDEGPNLVRVVGWAKKYTGCTCMGRQSTGGGAGGGRKNGPRY